MLVLKYPRFQEGAIFLQRGYPIFLIIDPMARHMSILWLTTHHMSILWLTSWAVEIWHRSEILGTSMPTQTILEASESAILTITERIYGQKASTKPYPYAPFNYDYLNWYNILIIILKKFVHQLRVKSLRAFKRKNNNILQTKYQ